MRSYTFVTVFFDLEIDFIVLQARSFQNFCPIELVDSIVLINNSQSRLSKNSLKQIQNAYGILSNKVSVLNSDQVTRYANKISGWYSQQLIKLLIARQVRTDRYVVLDAKNFLIRNIERDFLEDSSDAALIRENDFTSHILRPFLERCLDYFGLDKSRYIKNFPVTTTPFVIYTKIALELVAHVEERESLNFEKVFIDKKFTEFFLYSAYIASKYRDFEPLYSFHAQPSIIAWKKDASSVLLNDQIAKSKTSLSPFFAVHRQAIGNLDDKAREQLAAFWTEINLFDTTKEASDFLTPFHRKVWRKLVIHKIVQRLHYYLIRLNLKREKPP